MAKAVDPARSFWAAPRPSVQLLLWCPLLSFHSTGPAVLCDHADESPGRVGARFFAVRTAPGTVHMTVGSVSSSSPARSPQAASPGPPGAGLTDGQLILHTGRGGRNNRRRAVVSRSPRSRLPYCGAVLHCRKCFWNEHTWRTIATGCRGGS